jgi:hypothetical protein
LNAARFDAHRKEDGQMNGVRGLVSSLALALAALASMAVGAADVVLRTEAGPCG